MLLLSVQTLSLKPNFHSSTSTNRVSGEAKKIREAFYKEQNWASCMQLSTVQIPHRLTNQEYVLLVVWCLHRWISAWLQPQTEQTSKWGQFLPLHWLRTSLFTLVNSPITLRLFPGSDTTLKWSLSSTISCTMNLHVSPPTTPSSPPHCSLITTILQLLPQVSI